MHFPVFLVGHGNELHILNVLFVYLKDKVTERGEIEEERHLLAISK